MTDKLRLSEQSDDLFKNLYFIISDLVTWNPCLAVIHPGFQSLGPNPQLKFTKTATLVNRIKKQLL